MPWYKKPQFTALKPRPAAKQANQKVPEGLWHRCPACLTIIYARDFENNLRVCQSCGFHEKLSSQERIEMLVDEGSFEEMDTTVRAKDPLNFVDSKPYAARLAAMWKKNPDLLDAVRTGLGRIGGQQVSMAVMDFSFVGGSMGAVVGEKITRAIERGIELKIPVITVVTSGGARMQESTYSLMQMAKTSAALAKLDTARLPHFVILTNPSTAGVMASYGSLGDVILAEPDALIGFAGPRVIEQTIRQILPRGFQRSDFVREHGFLDIVCHRTDMRETIAKLLGLLRGPEQEDLDSESVADGGSSHQGENGREAATAILQSVEMPADEKPARKSPKKAASKKRTVGKPKARSSRAR